MDSVRTLAGETGLMKKMRLWNVNQKKVTNDGSKYGGQNDGDKVHNPIIGFATVAQVKALERQGVIVYQFNTWRVPKAEVLVNGKMKITVSHKYLNYIRERSGRSIDEVIVRQTLLRQEYDRVPQREPDEREIMGG